MTGCQNMCIQLCVAQYGQLGNMHTHIVVRVAGVSMANRRQSVRLSTSGCGSHSNVSVLEQLRAASTNPCNTLGFITTFKITASLLKMPHYTSLRTYNSIPCHVLLKFSLDALKKVISKNNLLFSPCSPSMHQGPKHVIVSD